MSTADAGMPTAATEERAAEGEATAGGGLNFASIGQTYETTIYADKAPSMLFVTFPRAAVDVKTPISVEGTLRTLGLDDLEGKQFYPAELPWMLWMCLTDGRSYPEGDRGAWSEEDRRLFEFAEYLAFEDLIPFELSPQQSRSLAKLMTMGALGGAALGGAKIGATGGFIVGAAGGPLVIVTTTAGFVLGGLVGAATGALGERLYGKLEGPSKPKTARRTRKHYVF